MLQKELLLECDYEGYIFRNILLNVQNADGLFIVSEPTTGAYGTGTTMNEAVEEFKSMFVDLFEDLTRSEKILSRILSLRLRHMQLFIEMDENKRMKILKSGMDTEKFEIDIDPKNEEDRFWLKACESSFDFWDNESDARFDTL